MLDWLKNITKEHPEFWKEYLSKFDTKPKSRRFVILSTETSGLNPNKDVILSFGCVAVIDGQIIIGDSFNLALLQYKYLHDSGLTNDFLIESKQPKLAEPEAIEAFVNYIGSAVLVGYHIDFDVDMINEVLQKLNCGRLKNEAIDIEIMYKKWKDSIDKSFSLDELCTEFKIAKGERHTSSEEAYNIGLLFLKLKSRLGIQ